MTTRAKLPRNLCQYDDKLLESGNNGVRILKASFEMMPSSTTATSIRNEQGFDVFVLCNGSIDLAVVPELGAKVISLRNLRSGREWMSSPAGGMKLFRNRLADDFATSSLVGWDECLPTIAPCNWQSRQLPDHGEAWTAAWTVDREAWRRGELRTLVRLPISPFDFQRAINLGDGEIRVDYAITNTGDASEYFLWAMHPLLTIADGDCLELPAEVRDLLAAETWIDSLDFGDRTPACAKTFAGPLSQGTAGVLNRKTGDRLTFVWDSAENDTLGLWLTRGGWNGQHHVAVEPTNGMPDSLAVAAGQHRCGRIPAHSSVAWSVRILVDPH
jgi:hypothetical protein